MVAAGELAMDTMIANITAVVEQWVSHVAARRWIGRCWGR